MAAHKVPQDVEADDKFLGPLSFKQFLFAGGMIITGYLIFYTLSKNLWFLTIFVFPVFLVFVAFTIPWSKNQPTELWLGARIRFFIKPRTRVWDQSGLKELVTITAPERATHAFTDGLSLGEVQTRMSALATMVDSRGWAVKNYGVLSPTTEASDRLVAAPQNSPTELEAISISTPDVMDESSGVIAKQFDSMIQKSETKHKDYTKEIIEKARHDIGATASSSQEPKKIKDKKQEDFWFMHQNQQPSNSKYTTFQSSPVINPQIINPDTPAQIEESVTFDEPSSKPMSEKELLKRAHAEEERKAMIHGPQHEKVVKPYDAKAEAEEAERERLRAEAQRITEQEEYERRKAESQAQAKSTVTPITDPDILELANNNDLNVATLSRQANKDRNLPTDEVVISLHDK